MQKPIIDVHIEKTAGRSKRQLLIDTFGGERVLHYDCSTDRLVRAASRLIVTESPLQEKVQELAKNRLLFPVIKIDYLALKKLENASGFKPEDIPTGYDVVTGHLTGDRFADIIPPEESTYTSVLRDPLERAVSHYRHWQRSRGLARFRLTPNFNPGTSFEDFVFLPGMTNYQTAALGISPTRFAVLGTTNNLSGYFEELGIPLTQPVPHMNKSSDSAPLKLDTAFMREFVDANVDDYELYTQVTEKYPLTPAKTSRLSVA